MSKVTYYEWKPEDYRRLMLSSSRVDGVSYPRPLYETNYEEWHKRFDANAIREVEPNYLAINVITAVLGVALILIYHFG